MFSLLSPLSLWFGALLAVPLAIHFLGRQRLERQPFPSLLLVKEGFARSMRRHRLKNLLLLIIRTLLIACLLLALSNPALESRHAAGKPDQSLALLHNGIYGKLTPADGSSATAFASAAPRGKDLLETQRLRIKESDSAEGTRTRIFPVIEDGAGAGEIAERFGDYPEAVRRLLAALGPGTASVNLPVFAWTDLSACQTDLLRALRDDPGLQLILTDFSPRVPRLSAFADLRATPAADAPTVSLSARLSPAAAAVGGKSQVWLDGRLFQEAPAVGGRIDVTLPLGAGPRTEGRFAYAGVAGDSRGYAAADLHFCFPQAGAWTLAHAGNALVSLPSLGRETYFRRIAHVASARDIPWGGTVPKEKAAPAAPLRLVYLSAEGAVPTEAYARAVEFVRQGGRLIVAVGRASDIPGLNRFLLQPLRLGRLGNLVEGSGPVSADRQALARVAQATGNVAAAGNLGDVRKRYAFAPDSGTAVLLAQGGAAVLAERDFHQGHALLWTTDIDDLDWTDLGVKPLVPLLHQAFQETAAGERAANLAVAADSIYMLALPAGAEGAEAEARDPEGRPFTRTRIEGGRMRIGPFDRLGLYRVIQGKDTSDFAVNLLPSTPMALSAPTPASEEWASADAAAKEAFLAAGQAYHGRISVLAEDDPVTARTSVRRLWPAFLLGAILLLFLEGLISSRFSARRTRP